MTTPQHAWGYVREDGFVFTHYRDNGSPKFISPKAFFRKKILTILGAARNRAKERNLAFDLDIEYLISIFPQDNLCPVLGFEFSMTPGAGLVPNSPSIDRIVPALGYTKGNVIWVSHLANTIKSNATPDQIKKVAEFYEDLYSQE